MTTIHCFSCAEEVKEADVCNTDGNNYCVACFDARFTDCARCARTVKIEDLQAVTIDYGHNAEPWCPNCVNRATTTCTECARVVDDSTMSTTEGPDGNQYCDNCVTFSPCDGCNETIWDSDAYSSDGEGTYCQSCYDERDEEDEEDEGCKLLRSYGYKPEPIFYKLAHEKTPKTKSLLFFGMELETEGRALNSSTKLCNKIHEHLDAQLNRVTSKLYYKTDGSLNDGVEIVTHPMTLEYIRHNKLFEAFDGMRDFAKSYGTNRCGFHVHVPRTAFTPLHIYKYMWFHYLNPSFIALIAQRESSHYSHIPDWVAHKKVTFYADGEEIESESMATPIKLKLAPIPWQKERYELLNFTQHTVEHRYFIGNLRADRLYKNVEFIHALYTFTLNASIKDSLSLKSFKRFLNDNKKRYPNLIAFLASRKEEEVENAKQTVLAKIKQKVIGHAEEVATYSSASENMHNIVPSYLQHVRDWSTFAVPGKLKEEKEAAIKARLAREAEDLEAERQRGQSLIHAMRSEMLELYARVQTLPESVRPYWMRASNSDWATLDAFTHWYDFNGHTSINTIRAMRQTMQDAIEQYAAEQAVPNSVDYVIRRASTALDPLAPIIADELPIFVFNEADGRALSGSTPSSFSPSFTLTEILADLHNYIDADTYIPF